MVKDLASITVGVDIGRGSRGYVYRHVQMHGLDLLIIGFESTTDLENEVGEKG